MPNLHEKDFLKLKEVINEYFNSDYQECHEYKDFGVIDGVYSIEQLMEIIGRKFIVLLRDVE